MSLWTEKRGQRYAGYGASDIGAGSPVTPQLSTTNLRSYVPAASSNAELAGLTWQDTKAANGIAVYFDRTSVRRMILNATVATAGVPIGVVGTTNGLIHPLSGATYIQPLYGPVAAVAAVATGATAAIVSTPVWQIGEAMEPGIPGQPIAVSINPRQLSGLA